MATLLTRFALLPIMIKIQRTTAKLQMIKPISAPIQARMDKAKAANDQPT